MTKQLTFLGVIIAFVACAFALSLVYSTPTAGAQSLTSLANLEAGDLVRGESFSAVYYYGADGFRYVFPNSKTYFTWYDNFDSVKWLADSDMTQVQIGGNVTYKPGKRMIKINSDPKTYAVGAGGELRHVTSEAVAVALYGSNWNKMIDDVPDGFFPNYNIGSALDSAGQFNADAEENEATGIGKNKNLKDATVVSLSESGFSPVSVTIDVNTAVRFENNGTGKHGASADSKKWGTGTINPGKNFSRYFKDTGTFTYHDKYDSAKTATVIVQ